MFLYLLPYVYIFGFCIVSLQCINVSSGMYKLVSNNRYPTNPPAHMFLNLVILPRGKRFFKGIYVLRFVLVSKRILIFLISVCFPFFTRLLNRRTVSIFYSSRLSFWLVLDNLSKKLIICSQRFDVLAIANRPFTTVPLGRWNLSKIHPPIHTIILLLET